MRLVHSECSLGWGGQEHRVLDELNGFRSRGHVAWLMAPRESCIAARAVGNGVPTWALSGGKLRFGWTLIQTAAWLRAHRVQIVNTHSSRDGWLVGLAARWARVPLLIRSRHIDVSYPNRRISRHAFTTLADHVITTSDRITRHLQDCFGLSAGRITTVPTGVDLQRFQPEGARETWEMGRANASTIGMVSVLRSWKGHATFLEAMALLISQSGENACLRGVIVGDGPLKANIAKMIHDLGLTGKVFMVGHREGIPEILRSLDLLVIPSTAHEGVPQIGLQALASRTPVIGSDVGGIPEIIRPGETGRLFPAGDATALARGIEESIAQSEKTNAMTERGLRLVERLYSRERMFDRLQAIYDRHLVGLPTCREGSGR